MALKTKSELKEFFEDGDTPNENEFGFLIDSMLNLAEGGTQVIAGTISASGVNAGAYSLESLDFGSITTNITPISLTSSNIFGSESAGGPHGSGLTSHSFFGPIFQSSSGDGSASYFLSTTLFGTTTSSQSPHGGVSIFKGKDIGNANPDISQLSQLRSSSLAIFNSNTNHLIFDENQIVQRGSDELEIRADGVSESQGRVKILANITGSTQAGSTQGLLIVSSSGNVGIGTTTPNFTLDINQPSASMRIKNSISSIHDVGNVHLALLSSQ